MLVHVYFSKYIISSQQTKKSKTQRFKKKELRKRERKSERNIEGNSDAASTQR